MAISKRVLLFPGQGIQGVGMCDAFSKYTWNSVILERVDEALQFSVGSMQLSKLMREGPEDQLNLTEYAQPAIMTSSIVSATQLHWHYLKEMYGISETNFCYALGHSLGEYTACVIGGAISIEDGVKLAYVRGKSMQEAVVGLSTRMAAVMASQSVVRQALSEIAVDGICEIAGINHDKQIVLSGTRESVDKITEHLKKNFKVPVKNLNVSAPFHCRLMKPAAERVEKELESMKINKSVVPVISNATSLPVTEPDEIKKSLVDNIVSPAMFLRGMEFVLQKGCFVFKEFGSKKVLSGLVGKIIQDRKLEGIAVEEVS
jgi:[acyl-carrier-protein] S-malonyltransferase